MTSEFSTQRTQTKDRRNIDQSLKSNTGEKESETPLPRYLDDINRGDRGEESHPDNAQSPSI